MRFGSQQPSPRQHHAVATAEITNPSASYQARPRFGEALDIELRKCSKHFIIEVTNYVETHGTGKATWQVCTLSMSTAR